MAVGDKRRHARISVDVAVQVIVGDSEPRPGTIANFSQQGLFLRTTADLRVGQSVRLSFVLKPDHTPCEATGTIAWQGPLGVGLGLSEASDSYNEFIAALEAAADQGTDRAVGEVTGRFVVEPNIEID